MRIQNLWMFGFQFYVPFWAVRESIKIFLIYGRVITFQWISITNGDSFSEFIRLSFNIRFETRKHLKNRTKINWDDQKQFILFNNVSNFVKKQSTMRENRLCFFLYIWQHLTPFYIMISYSRLRSREDFSRSFYFSTNKISEICNDTLGYVKMY